MHIRKKEQMKYIYNGKSERDNNIANKPYYPPSRHPSLSLSIPPTSHTHSPHAVAASVMTSTWDGDTPWLNGNDLRINLFTHIFLFVCFLILVQWDIEDLFVLCLLFFLVYIHYIISVYIHYFTIYHSFVYLIHYNIRIYTLHYYLLSICILNSLYYSFMFAYHYHLFVYLIHYIIRFSPVHHYSLFIYSYAWSITCLNSPRIHCMYTFIFSNIFIHSFTHQETQVLLLNLIIQVSTLCIYLLTLTHRDSTFIRFPSSCIFIDLLTPYIFKYICLSIIFSVWWMIEVSFPHLFIHKFIHSHS